VEPDDEDAELDELAEAISEPEPAYVTKALQREARLYERESGQTEMAKEPEPPKSTAGSVCSACRGVFKKTEIVLRDTYSYCTPCVTRLIETEREDFSFSYSLENVFEDVGEPSYLIDGLLPDNALTILSGASGARKSFIAESLSLCVATGTSWLGHKTDQGVTLNVWLEGSQADWKDRTLRLAKGIGFEFADLRRTFLPYMEALTPQDQDSWTEFLALVRSLKPRLIVIDHMTRLAISATQASLTDAAVLSGILAPLADLAQGKIPDVPACAVLLLHHSNASGEMRGADSVKLHMDRVLYLRADSDDPASLVHLTSGKMRTLATEVDLTVRLADGPGTLAVERATKRRDSKEREPDDPDAEHRAQLLALLPLKPEELNRAMQQRGCSRQNVYRIRDKLQSDGAIGQRDGKWCRLGIDNAVGA